jgi:hypothetical protein
VRLLPDRAVGARLEIGFQILFMGLGATFDFWPGQADNFDPGLHGRIMF